MSTKKKKVPNLFPKAFLMAGHKRRAKTIKKVLVKPLRLGLLEEIEEEVLDAYCDRSDELTDEERFELLRTLGSRLQMWEEEAEYTLEAKKEKSRHG